MLKRIRSIKGRKGDIRTTEKTDTTRKRETPDGGSVEKEGGNCQAIPSGKRTQKKISMWFHVQTVQAEGKKKKNALILIAREKKKKSPPAKRERSRGRATLKKTERQSEEKFVTAGKKMCAEVAKRRS